MPVQVDGFSQTHVSGTGGGPKYGNVLIQPFCSGFEKSSHPAYRADEDIRLGYYGTHYTNGIGVEVTTAERASMYRITYPQDSAQMLVVDAGWFLGDQVGIDTRESQQFVASEVEVKSDHEVSGFTRIRGGWNNGKAYTVYFSLLFSKKIEKEKLLDNHGKQAVTLCFDAEGGRELNVKVGISFVGERKAKQNIAQYIGAKTFEEVEQACVAKWEKIFQKVSVGTLPDSTYLRMFYTGLYHTMLEPVDRTGENPGWTDYVNNDPALGEVPYYDDFYAIWDTYRTSSPLITLLEPQRQTDIVNSLINIGKRDGYMPDARSGNCNGRTQGGSNADVVLADAFVKGLGIAESGKLKAESGKQKVESGKLFRFSPREQARRKAERNRIDWEEGLKQMLKDATLPPGGNQEAEGRGGLTEYLRLGYVPFGIDRSGNRTMEYAFCDYAIAQVAKGLGYESLYQQYMRQSGYWKNLWRADYEHAGTRGFIMPRAADGHWLDTLTVGHSKALKPKFVYTPVTNESPWNQAWWGTVFYEATSWEYSLSVPHDVPGLIDICGGEAAFEKRLDTFFDQGFYNVNNEPSFLTPCLYHWLGKPERTSDRVREIIDKHFNDGPVGLPGNDDSGSMSSWLVFHMMGLYPNAGTDYYLIHTPLLKSTTLHLDNGNDFTISAPKLSEKNRYIVGAKLNGIDYPYSTISHQEILAGGTLELLMGAKPKEWGKAFAKSPIQDKESDSQVAAPALFFDVPGKLQLNRDYRFDFDLRTQHRHFVFRFEEEEGELLLKWQLPRPNKIQKGVYRMSRKARESASELSYEAPVDGNNVSLPAHQLFAVLSREAFRDITHRGLCDYNNSTLELMESTGNLLHLRNFEEGYDLWVNNDERLPIIVKMKNNPVEIDWETHPLPLPQKEGRSY